MAFSEPLRRGPRILLVLLGLALVPASLAVGYLSLFFLDGLHPERVPGAVARLQRAYAASVLAVPLLLFLTGLAALLATNVARLKLVVALLLALAVDMPLAMGLYRALWAPPPCRSHPLPPGPRAVPVIDATGCPPAH